MTLLALLHKFTGPYRAPARPDGPASFTVATLYRQPDGTYARDEHGPGYCR